MPGLAWDATTRNRSPSGYRQLSHSRSTSRSPTPEHNRFWRVRPPMYTPPIRDLLRDLKTLIENLIQQQEDTDRLVRRILDHHMYSQ